jgi:hypothetical protein
MGRIPIVKLLTAAAFMASCVAMAADKETVLSHISSPVMVNQGKAYVEASEGMQLYSGDQLMVMSGGSAQVNYANGCVLKISGSEMMRIGSSQDLCSSPASAGTNHQIGGAGGPPAGGSGTSGTVGGGLSTGNMVGLGLTLGAMGYAGYEMFDNDNDRNDISP